jgi:hypothetical protein
MNRFSCGPFCLILIDQTAHRGEGLRAFAVRNQRDGKPFAEAVAHRLQDARLGDDEEGTAQTRMV